MRKNVLDDRELGQTGVSVGTSLALEGALGIYPEREVPKAPINDYDGLWINVSTLIRNMFNSLTKDMKNAVLTEDIVVEVANEMMLIPAALAGTVKKGFNVVYYVNDMSNIKKYFPKATLKSPTTKNQQIYNAIHDMAIREILSQYRKDYDIQVNNMKIRGSGNALILTHSPIDLLSHVNFKSLVLLESHTGHLKKRSEWHTKIGVQDINLPLNVFTISVFGDHGTFLVPMSIKYKRAVLKLASSDRWTPITTMAKIRAGVSSIKDNEIREALLERCSETSFLT